MKPLVQALKAFRPRLLPCLAGLLVCAGVSLYAVMADGAAALPPIVLYAVYAAAFGFLTLTVWALMLFVRDEEPKKRLSDKLASHALSARLMNDPAYRIRVTGYASLVLNILLALSRGVIGWLTSSNWLIVLAGYYLVLCVAKAWLLEKDRMIAKGTDEAARIQQEWRLYRLCGILLIVMMAFLQGVVIKIVRDNDTFSYDGLLIYAAAAYDFYRLIASIVYMVRTRKKHAPTTVSIKVISFATSLVAMLSLQTAMFASFGKGTEDAMKMIMNLATGTGVCLLLLTMGIVMVAHGSRQIKRSA